VRIVEGRDIDPGLVTGVRSSTLVNASAAVVVVVAGDSCQFPLSFIHCFDFFLFLSAVDSDSAWAVFDWSERSVIQMNNTHYCASEGSLIQ
jgi:hypothetical protein